MKNMIFKLSFGLLVICLATASALAQGRGRGRNQDGKCSVFVNCHDARDGRWDGRGPQTSRVNRSVFVSRGDRVAYRNRYNMNDYWRHRHMTTLSGWRYRNRPGRN
jgi:hypothetical protein